MPSRPLSFRVAQPHHELRPWIRCYYLLESPENDVRSRQGLLVPDGHLELGIHLDGARTDRILEAWRERPGICVDEVLVGPRRVQWQSPIRFVGVKFRYGAGLALFGLRTLDVATEPLDATTLSHVRCGDLAERLASSPSWSERSAHLDAFFLDMLPGAEPDALVATGLATVLSSAGSVAIESLARSLGVSRRLLEYRVKARTGMTPKRLSQIVRTREAIRRIRRKPHRPLGAVAAGLGYCDQSHFIREFKATAGSAPTKFFSDDQFVADFCRQA